MIACALVTALFLASAVLVPTIVRRLKLPPRNKKILAAAILFSLFAKLAVTQFSIVTMPELAYQGDYATWKTVAGLMAEHKNIYVERSDGFCDVPYLSCYNFAPAWAWIALGLDRISTFLHGQTIAAFRLTLTAFLAATDVLIALVLAGEYSYTAALVYLLAPVIMWTEAYEGNFNNLALLVALLAWVLIRWEKPTSRAVFLSAVLTGLSLTIKHILALFPVWLLFYKPLGKLRHRLAYAAIAYGIFFCSFLPWWFDPASRNGIMERVFRYNGNYGFSVVGRVTAVLVPISRLDAAFHWLPLLSAFKLFWLILLIVIGMLAAKRNTNELLLCYLLALYGFSIGLFDEYLMIPLRDFLQIMGQLGIYAVVGGSDGNQDCFTAHVSSQPASPGYFGRPLRMAVYLGVALDDPGLCQPVVHHCFSGAPLARSLRSRNESADAGHDTA